MVAFGYGSDMIKRADIPPLPPSCNSWIVVRNDTGKPAFETTSIRALQCLKPEAVTIYTALAWLQKLNTTPDARA
jgi:hypothetical protein